MHRKEGALCGAYFGTCLVSGRDKRLQGVYGAFTLHGTGTGSGTGNGTRINGFLYIMFTVHNALRQRQGPDPLSPIVLVPFPVPVTVPVPCSVNKPLVLVDQTLVISEDDYTWCCAPESDCVSFKFQDWKNIFDPHYSSNIDG